ncbi:hypothetical protein PIB30_030968 [Stylosanthes scabra]|uniref:Uncharacterized protein n=1 Tax=Stylosanthes scabra TaxID=79078 RepID=A0ABU6TCT6_9FABA|nr:hypothetical protein [Stylosanthes scabra]
MSIPLIGTSKSCRVAVSPLDQCNEDCEAFPNAMCQFPPAMSRHSKSALTLTKPLIWLASAWRMYHAALILTLSELLCQRYTTTSSGEE